jgi:hypothetical protein
MILDTIIGVFVSLFTLLVEGLTGILLALGNLLATGIEALVGIFISGFRLRRFDRKRIPSHSGLHAPGGVLTLLVLIALTVWLFVLPPVTTRKITLIAKDGHTLPFAALIIHTKAGDRHDRTDNAGRIVIPRFGVHALTIKDPRYVEKTWQKSEIEQKLTVSRTRLGAGLDTLTGRLLKPADE